MPPSSQLGQSKITPESSPAETLIAPQNQEAIYVAPTGNPEIRYPEYQPDPALQLGREGAELAHAVAIFPFGQSGVANKLARGWSDFKERMKERVGNLWGRKTEVDEQAQIQLQDQGSESKAEEFAKKLSAKLESLGLKTSLFGRRGSEGLDFSREISKKYDSLLLDSKVVINDPTEKGEQKIPTEKSKKLTTIADLATVIVNGDKQLDPEARLTALANTYMKSAKLPPLRDLMADKLGLKLTPDGKFDQKDLRRKIYDAPVKTKQEIAELVLEVGSAMQMIDPESAKDIDAQMRSLKRERTHKVYAGMQESFQKELLVDGISGIELTPEEVHSLNQVFQNYQGRPHRFWRDLIMGNSGYIDKGSGRYDLGPDPLEFISDWGKRVAIRDKAAQKLTISNINGCAWTNYTKEMMDRWDYMNTHGQDLAEVEVRTPKPDVDSFGVYPYLAAVKALKNLRVEKSLPAEFAEPDPLKEGEFETSLSYKVPIPGVLSEYSGDRFANRLMTFHKRVNGKDVFIAVDDKVVDHRSAYRSLMKCFEVANLQDSPDKLFFKFIPGSSIAQDSAAEGAKVLVDDHNTGVGIVQIPQQSFDFNSSVLYSEEENEQYGKGTAKSISLAKEVGFTGGLVWSQSKNYDPQGEVFRPITEITAQHHLFQGVDTTRLVENYTWELSERLNRHIIHDENLFKEVFKKSYGESLSAELAMTEYALVKYEAIAKYSAERMYDDEQEAELAYQKDISTTTVSREIFIKQYVNAKFQNYFERYFNSNYLSLIPADSPIKPPWEAYRSMMDFFANNAVEKLTTDNPVVNKSILENAQALFRSNSDIYRLKESAVNSSFVMFAPAEFKIFDPEHEVRWGRLVKEFKRKQEAYGQHVLPSNEVSRYQYQADYVKDLLAMKIRFLRLLESDMIARKIGDNSLQDLPEYVVHRVFDFSQKKGFHAVDVADGEGEVHRYTVDQTRITKTLYGEREEDGVMFNIEFNEYYDLWRVLGKTSHNNMAAVVTEFVFRPAYVNALQEYKDAVLNGQYFEGGFPPEKDLEILRAVEVERARLVESMQSQSTVARLKTQVQIAEIDTRIKFLKDEIEELKYELVDAIDEQLGRVTSSPLGCLVDIPVMDESLRVAACSINLPHRDITLIKNVSEFRKIYGDGIRASLDKGIALGRRGLHSSAEPTEEFLALAPGVYESSTMSYQMGNERIFPGNRRIIEKASERKRVLGIISDTLMAANKYTALNLPTQIGMGIQQNMLTALQSGTSTHVMISSPGGEQRSHGRPAGTNHLLSVMPSADGFSLKTQPMPPFMNDIFSRHLAQNFTTFRAQMKFLAEQLPPEKDVDSSQPFKEVAIDELVLNDPVVSLLELDHLGGLYGFLNLNRTIDSGYIGDVLLRDAKIIIAASDYGRQNKAELIPELLELQDDVKVTPERLEYLVDDLEDLFTREETGTGSSSDQVYRDITSNIANRNFVKALIHSLHVAGTIKESTRIEPKDKNYIKDLFMHIRHCENTGEEPLPGSVEKLREIRLALILDNLSEASAAVVNELFIELYNEGVALNPGVDTKSGVNIGHDLLTDCYGAMHFWNGTNVARWGDPRAMKNQQWTKYIYNPTSAAGQQGTLFGATPGFLRGAGSNLSPARSSVQPSPATTQQFIPVTPDISPEELDKLMEEHSVDPDAAFSDKSQTMVVAADLKRRLEEMGYGPKGMSGGR